MKHSEGAYPEVESTGELLTRVESGHGLHHVVVQGLDLTGPDVEEAILEVSAYDSFFLGCRMTPRLQQHIRLSGGTIFPVFEELPFNPYRSSLYTPEELMMGYINGRPESMIETVDGQIYSHYAQFRDAATPAPIMMALAERIHDHAIDDALTDLLYPVDEPAKQVVGIMGGHSMARDAEAFLSVARIAWQLARGGYYIATGGGPGAMEAGNLGAYMAAFDEDELITAVQMLADQPHYTDTHYFERAYAVRDAYPDGWDSLAIPTWFYGHEPSNLFSTQIAKYFANSLREDGLLAIATYGVIYAPGSAGTIQEIFMDAAQNHYVTFQLVSPMVFFGTDYWTQQKPVYPLLKTLAKGHRYNDLLTMSDEVDEVVRFIEAHEPVLPE
ncbi:MAG TPA: hypothetical protein VKP65_04850 [Rhodothermales bacterium]|nr:hypothetical protein [Rhodothermales bacterium]